VSVRRSMPATLRPKASPVPVFALINSRGEVEKWIQFERRLASVFISTFKS
jgi:hypothetical protein